MALDRSPSRVKTVGREADRCELGGGEHGRRELRSMELLETGEEIGRASGAPFRFKRPVGVRVHGGLNGCGALQALGLTASVAASRKVSGRFGPPFRRRREKAGADDMPGAAARFEPACSLIAQGVGHAALRAGAGN